MYHKIFLGTVIICFLCLLIQFFINRKLSLNTEKTRLAVFLHSFFVICNLMYEFSNKLLDQIYFSGLSVIFLPLLFKSIKTPKHYLIFVISATFVNVWFQFEFLIQIQYLVSFVILLYQAKESIMGPASKRMITMVFISISFFYFLTILQFTLFNIPFEWRKSTILIYYSYFYFLVVIFMYSYIIAKFRRLFFV